MMSDSRYISLELDLRKIDLIFKQNLSGLIALVFNASVYIFVSRNSVSYSFLIPWILILAASVVVRILAYRRWRFLRDKINTLDEVRKWLALLYLSLFVSGLSWGVLGWISHQGSESQQIITALIVCSMVAGAMVTYMHSRIAVLLVAVPAMSLWMLGYLFDGNPDHKILAGMILVYSVLLAFIGGNIYRTVNRSLERDVRLQKNEERLRLAMESTDCLIWDWELREEDLYWEGNLNLFPKGKRQLQEFLNSSMEHKADIDGEYMVPGPDGHLCFVAIRGKFYRDQVGIPYRFSGICWDVTTKKITENLRQERDLHETANRAKSVVIANASHELRTPLAAISGFSENLLHNRNIDSDARKDIQTILRQTNYMASLINDLLDLTKVESNRIYIQSAPMNPVQEIEDAIEVIKNLANHKSLVLQVSYETEIPSSIECDSVRFRQVLINLLNNAVKFTFEGQITVKVFYIVDRDHRATFKIQVVDSGLGMDTLTQKNLFQPFIRGEAPEVQRVQGSGLGLALSSSLMRMMGGELKLLKSVRGEGSTFEMSFDLGTVELSPGSKDAVGKRPDAEFLKKRRVLVVDDSVDLRALMTRYLSRQGAEVETSENGAEAVEKALASPFDIILMDIKMPVMDGYEATRILRKNGYTHPVVALTAQASVDGKQKCLDMGFDGYLSKPVDMSLLREILRGKSEFSESSKV